MTITLFHLAWDSVPGLASQVSFDGSGCFLKLESLHPIQAFWEDSPQKTCLALSLSGKLKSATEEEKEREGSRQDEIPRPLQSCPGQSLKILVNINPSDLPKHLTTCLGITVSLVFGLAGDSCTNSSGL